LETVVMALVSTAPAYGYEIARSLTRLRLGEVKGGTLYPLLGRLTEAEYVEAVWRMGEEGPRRRYYTLTPLGAEELARRKAEWLMIRSAIDDVLGGVVA
jgi:PadR family transcriptional regulator PadR